MKPKREVVVAAAVALALTVMLIGAVGAKVMSSLAEEQNVITNLRMSDSCGGDEVILFPAGTQTVYVVFDYFNMQGQPPYRIAVTDGVELYNATHSYTGSGTECITVTYTPSIPPDTYRTQIWEGDFPKTPTKLWHVRPGGPGQITNLYMSLSPDGPPMTEFIEGTRTVWAVFDYVGMEGNEVEVKVYENGESHAISSGVSLTGSGTQAISVTHQLMTGFPPGQYRTHILKDGFVDDVEYWSVLYGVYLPLVLKKQS